MGFGMPHIGYLSDKGYLNKPKTRVLDIGSQCLLSATTDLLETFLSQHGKNNIAHISKEIEKLSYFSYPRPNERTTYLSELLDLTNIEYTSFDVCPALNTEIFDLNRESVPPRNRENFNIILNFGTTEHVINQLNCFKVIHDALAIGGVAIHQLPSIGFINHGYFNYHITLFQDLVKTNDYEILDWWYTPCGIYDLDSETVDMRKGETPHAVDSAKTSQPVQIPNFLINVILRKRSSHPFRLPLELTTAHASLSDQIEAQNITTEEAATQTGNGSSAINETPNISMIPGRELLRELKTRIKRRIFR